MLAWPAQAGRIFSGDWTEFRDFDVVIVGETHDNQLHHINQARAVSALKPGALVFEMLTPDLARLATAEMRRDALALGAALRWTERGWPDFAMYYPIFAAAPEAAVFGGDLPRDEVRRAVTEGAAAAFGGGAALFELDVPLPEGEQEAREAEQQAAHCDALPPDLLPGMVEAQRFRDALLAQAVVAALAESGGAPVVVITGNGHARRDWGLPAVLARLPDPPSVASIGQYETEAPADPPYDAWIVTAPAEREDPCAAFR